MREKKLISIVIPVFNEESNIMECYETLIEHCANHDKKYDFKFIFMDNHSTDQSFSILKKLTIKDPHVKVFRFSRNFGYQASIYTGYINAEGDAAIQFDCDLQDPVEKITDFLSKWEEGYKVVYGIRVQRKENIIITGIRLIFYRFISFISQNPLPLDAGDFRLIDRCIIDEMSKIYDSRPYIRGLSSSLGFKQIGIEYVRNERKKGESKFGFINMFSLAWDGIANHSILPLRLASFTGLLIGLATIFFGLVYTVAKFNFGKDWPGGFVTLVLLLLFSIFLNSIFLGIIGEYLGRIYTQVKKLPITIIEDSVTSSTDENFEEKMNKQFYV